MQRAWFFFALFGKKTEATAEPGAARPGAQKLKQSHYDHLAEDC